MIETTDIVKALEVLTLSVGEFKQIHTSLLPNGFKRPALLIDPRERKIRESSSHTVFINETIRLVTIADLNERGNVDTMRLVFLTERVSALFDSGKLAVKDRWLEASVDHTGRDGDASFLDIKLEYYTSRRETVPVLPLIEAVVAEIQAAGST